MAKRVKSPKVVSFENNRISEREALDRLEKMEGSRKFAAYRLHELMQAGLPTAFGCSTRGGRTTFLLLQKSELKRISANAYVARLTDKNARVYMWSGGLDAPPDDPLDKCWLYFDRQRFDEAFDSMYSPAATAYANDVLARGKPGPRPRKDWKVWVAYEFFRAQVNKEVVPTSTELAEYCQEKTGYLPPVDEVGRLVRKLRNAT
jgi:hypothetical protein